MVNAPSSLPFDAERVMRLALETFDIEARALIGLKARQGESFVHAVRADAPWLRALAKEGRPTAAAHTWLLKEGWRRGGGLIGVDEVPAERQPSD